MTSEPVPSGVGILEVEGDSSSSIILGVVDRFPFNLDLKSPWRLRVGRGSWDRTQNREHYLQQAPGPTGLREVY